MKKFFILLFSVLMMAMSSCVAGEAVAEPVVRYDVVLNYGSPYYYNVRVVYYYYDGYYYYPHYYGNNIRFHRYHRPLHHVPYNYNRYHRPYYGGGHTTQPRPHHPNSGHTMHGHSRPSVGHSGGGRRH